MKKIIFLPALAYALAGCVNNTPAPVPMDPQPPVDPAPISEVRVLSVREPEGLHTVQVGRYVDPGNPNVMHESHVLYVRSQSPTWNLRPNAPLTDQLAAGKLTVAAPVEAEYALQTEAMAEQNKQLQQFGEALLSARKDMIVAVQEMKDLRAAIDKSEKANIERIEKLEKSLSDLKRHVANFESQQK